MMKKIGIFLICTLLISGTITFSSYYWCNNYCHSNPPKGGNTYYVSTSGYDSNPGTQSNPFRTIQHACDVVNPGDTVYVRGGTYNEHITLTRSGTLSTPSN